MGTIQNNCLLITGWGDHIDVLFKTIKNYVPTKFKPLFSKTYGLANGTSTIVFVPTGSKMGWGIHEEHDNISEVIMEWCDESDHMFSYVWISYGELGTKVKEGNCKNENL